MRYFNSINYSLSKALLMIMFLFGITFSQSTLGFIDSGQRLEGTASHHVTLGDIDGDGDIDAFVGGEPAKAWLNDGNGNFIDNGQDFGSENSRSIELGDLDGDGDLDGFFAMQFEPSKVYFNDGNGQFMDSGQNLGIPGSSNSLDASLGDLDGDGDLDAFVTNYPLQANKVWLNDGNGNFSDNGQSLGSLSSI